MKNTIRTNYLLLASMLCVIILFNACQDDDNVSNNPNVQPTPTKSMSAKINGVTFVATSLDSYTLQGIVFIKGWTTDLKAIELRLVQNFTTGTHNFDIIGDYVGLCAISGLEMCMSESGTLNITEYTASTGKIKGTFSFNGVIGEDTNIAVTDGLFDFIL